MLPYDNNVPLLIGVYIIAIFKGIFCLRNLKKRETSFLRALIGYSNSGYLVLFTDSPPVPPSERH